MGVKNDMDNIQSLLENLDVYIWYPNIRVDKDTEIVISFNDMYPNSRYISYILIYIMKKLCYLSL